MDRKNNSRLCRAYERKEDLRLILKMTDPTEAEAALDAWCCRASHLRSEAFKELARKIKRNKAFILNTIKIGMSNARIESTNNKIKLIVRRSFGFRNIDSIFAMIYLVCSDLRIPLPNRNKTVDKVE